MKQFKSLTALLSLVILSYGCQTTVTTTNPSTSPAPVATTPASPVVTAPKPADDSTLLALSAATAPKLESLAADPAWKDAPELKLSAGGGANFAGKGSTTGTLKAVYNGDMVYFLMTYDDPTKSLQRSPFVKQADGTWKKLSDPADKGGDNNTVYEDKFAFIWNIDNSIKNFNSAGCAATCHTGEAPKPYGNKYTASEGEKGDIWHMKYVRTGSVNFIDDQWVDHTKYSDATKDAGRKSDAKTSGGYADIVLKDGKPEFMNKDAKPANAGGTYWLNAADKVAFVDNFKTGDEIASIMVAPYVGGDRMDLPSASEWKDGKWTHAFSRKLVTGSATDVQFTKLDDTYYFGVAMFDNAQVRHAFTGGALKLQFSK